MGRFIHTADVHLGCHKEANLKKIEQKAFETIISECISRNADFMLICGDFFHINIPDMETSIFAAEQLSRLQERNIPAYVVYGSHDFSPVSKSMIDLLAAVNLVTKVTIPESADGKIRLKFVTDQRTGAKIAGMYGLKSGRDLDIYKSLDAKSLEDEPGFKIFLFHGALSEFVTEKHEQESMPISFLPRGFAYHAGGHMHKHSQEAYQGHPHIVYPGTPFAGHQSDIENNAKGTARGFVQADWDESGITSVNFVEIKSAEYEMIDIKCKNRDAKLVNDELLKSVGEIEPEGKIVVLKLAGEMSTGKTADIDISRARGEMINGGALEVLMRTNQLSSKEYSITSVSGSSREEIEANVFAENIGEVKMNRDELRGDAGVSLAKNMLSVLSNPKIADEKKMQYEERIRSRALDEMELVLDDTKEDKD